jgi:phosphoglycolate phosphatase
MQFLFDLDGTLCDPREGIAQGFQHAFDALALPFPGPAAVGPLIGRPLLDCCRQLGMGARSEEGARHFQAFFEGRGFAEAELYPGVLRCLQQLRGEGHGTAIASAKPTFAVRFVAEALGLLPWVDHLQGCEAEDLQPDKARIIDRALLELGWHPSDTVMVGDRAQDRDGASIHGMAFVAAAWGFGSPAEHSGALAVVKDPRDLLACLRGLAAVREGG